MRDGRAGSRYRPPSTWTMTESTDMGMPSSTSTSPGRSVKPKMLVKDAARMSPSTISTRLPRSARASPSPFTVDVLPTWGPNPVTAITFWPRSRIGSDSRVDRIR